MHGPQRHVRLPRNCLRNQLPEDAIFAAAQQAHLGPFKEPDGLLPGSDDHPVDIVLPFWDNGRDVCLDVCQSPEDDLDVCVVSPQQAALVQQAAREGGGDIHWRSTTPSGQR
jgi:hypothetical protein